MNDQHEGGSSAPNAPGAGPPPPRLNPSPPKPRINFVAVFFVLALVIGAGGIGVTALKSADRRAESSKEKLAAQRRADATRDRRLLGTDEWMAWAEATCQPLQPASAAIDDRLTTVAKGVDKTQTAPQMVVALGETFTMISDLFRAWAAAMTVEPRPTGPNGEAEVQVYVANLTTIADQTGAFAESLKATDLATVTEDEATESYKRSQALDRTVNELPDAKSVAAGVDAAAGCQAINDSVDANV